MKYADTVFLFKALDFHTTDVLRFTHGVCVMAKAMRKPAPDMPPSRVGQMIVARMDEKGLSINDLAAKTDITYEHARRIVRGEGIPSRFVIKEIAEYLNLPFSELEKAAVADRIEKRYGDMPLEISGKNPELEPLERVWGHLTEEQQKSAVAMIQAWARNNMRGT